MSEFDPITNASGYAYAFTNTDAPAYAAEWLNSLGTEQYATPDAIEEWAHETADSMAAVIYTGQAVALYAAGIITDEDDDLASTALQGEGMSVTERIDQAITTLSYAWHKRILLAAVEELLQDHAVV